MELREQMENTGAIFHTSIDSEIIAYGHCAGTRSFQNGRRSDSAHGKEIRGLCPCHHEPEKTPSACADPYGLKPLCIGKRDNAWVLASKVAPSTSIGAEFVRDVAPGEIVTFDKTGNLKLEFMPVDVKSALYFEYIYFARLDSKNRQYQCLRGQNPRRCNSSQRPTWLTQTRLWCPGLRTCLRKGLFRRIRIPFGLAFHKTAMSAVPSSADPEGTGIQRQNQAERSSNLL